SSIQDEPRRQADHPPPSRCRPLIEAGYGSRSITGGSPSPGHRPRRSVRIRKRFVIVASIGLLALTVACSDGGSDPRTPFCDRVARLQQVLRALPPGSTVDVKLVEQQLADIEIGFAQDASAFRQ